MKKRSETVNRLVNEFHSLWMKGMTIAEISERLGVSVRYCYMLLDEIAKKNGVDRKSYLVRPFFSRTYNNTTVVNNFHRYDIEEIQGVISNCDELDREIMGCLEEIEKVNNRINREE